MKFSRSIKYFLQLRALLGHKAACALAFKHALNKINPPSNVKLAHIPVGPYVFYFSSLDYFVGLFTEIFFEETYFLAPTQKPINVIDCGANIGLSLLYIKIRAPKARVLCFEPNPAARAVLEKNIDANNWGKDVRVLPYALGKRKGVVNFFVESEAATSSGGNTINYSKKEGQKLNSYPIEVDVLSQYIDHDIDLLKMDIEGSEFDALEELVSQQKLRWISELQLEYHYIPGLLTRPLSEVLILFESNGFRTFVQSTSMPHNIVNHDIAHTYMIFAWRQ